MTEQHSEFNLRFHLKIIYTFLAINVSFCTLCLYLLINRRTDSSGNNDVFDVSYGKYNSTVEIIKEREKRGLYSSIYHSVSKTKQ